MNLQIQEAQQTPRMINSENHSETIVVNLSRLKGKERILKAAREKELITR